MLKKDLLEAMQLSFPHRSSEALKKWLQILNWKLPAHTQVLVMPDEQHQRQSCTSTYAKIKPKVGQKRPTYCGVLTCLRKT